jgi:hypothetical protein
MMMMIETLFEIKKLKWGVFLDEIDMK